MKIFDLSIAQLFVLFSVLSIIFFAHIQKNGYLFIGYR